MILSSKWCLTPLPQSPNLLQRSLTQCKTLWLILSCKMNFILSKTRSATTTPIIQILTKTKTQVDFTKWAKTCYCTTQTMDSSTKCSRTSTQTMCTSRRACIRWAALTKLSLLKITTNSPMYLSQSIHHPYSDRLPSTLWVTSFKSISTRVKSTWNNVKIWCNFKDRQQHQLHHFWNHRMASECILLQNDSLIIWFIN